MNPKIDRINRFLEWLTKVIALVLCLILVGASGMLTYFSMQNLFRGDTNAAVSDALFVVILLELVFVVRSFIKRGRINVGILVNVGVIAAVKQLVFALDSIEFYMALSFGIIFLSLGGLYVLEMIHYERKN